MSEVLIKGHHLKHNGGRLCQPYDWVTVHWKSYLTDNHEIMEDSRGFKKGHPMTFRLGHWESNKCWELAIVSMQAGEEVDMVCPHYYAYGGVEKWSHFGAKKIPANTDLEFKLEVLECEESIDALNEKNQLSNNKAPLIEKQSEWAAAEPIVGSGLMFDPDAVANNALRKAKKLAGSTCAKERSK